VTALTAAQAITAALVARARTGQGQHVRLAMLDATVAFLWPEGMAGHTFLDVKRHDWGQRRVRDLVFDTADGFITVGVISDAEWQGLTRALERPAWRDDPRFRTPANRERNAEARMTLTAEVLRSRTSAEWLARLDAEQVPCAPVVTRDELAAHPQIVANELIVESVHPHAGRMRQPRPAARFAVRRRRFGGRRRCSGSTPTRCCASSAARRPRSPRSAPRASSRDRRGGLTAGRRLD
jgi:crotonobetainyl-CoA:carnitine CoA-transferase CaiB-like acyl-CoA transferase